MTGHVCTFCGLAYVGEDPEVCDLCHDDMAKRWSRATETPWQTYDWQLDREGGW